ncbi:hypothetical protein EBT25_12520 [bacterium]|nr:hypothetical protein [bacterium]
MSASDHIQPYQMKLFMQAKELMGMPAGDLQGSPLAGSYLASKKLRESKEGSATGTRLGVLGDQPTLYDDIKKRGVQSPVTLEMYPGDTSWNVQIMDGHHRVATANDIDPNMHIPVQYVDNYRNDDQRQFMVL